MDLTRKTDFFEGWSWFKFSNLGLELLYGLSILQQCGKIAKSMNQKVLRVNFSFWRR